MSKKIYSVYGKFMVSDDGIVSTSAQALMVFVESMATIIIETDDMAPLCTVLYDVEKTTNMVLIPQFTCTKKGTKKYRTEFVFVLPVREHDPSQSDCQRKFLIKEYLEYMLSSDDISEDFRKEFMVNGKLDKVTKNLIKEFTDCLDLCVTCQFREEEVVA